MGIQSFLSDLINSQDDYKSGDYKTALNAFKIAQINSDVEGMTKANETLNNIEHNAGVKTDYDIIDRIYHTRLVKTKRDAIFT